MLVLLVNALLPTLWAFQCFSEYEFSWHDPSGNLHINLFSVSHYQMKLWSFFTRQTPRPPLLEAYFVAKLNPQFKAQFEEECPATLVMSHALIALDMASTGDFDKAAVHFEYAMHYYGAATPVHQHIILHAWPINISSAELSKAMLLQDDVVSDTRVDLIVHAPSTSDPLGSFIAHLQRYSQHGDRLLLGGHHDVGIEHVRDLFAEVHLVNSEHYCETYLEGASKWNTTTNVKVYINLDETISLPLIIKVLQTDHRYLPEFLPLGKTGPSVSSFGDPEEHVGTSFLLKKPATLSAIERMREACLESPSFMARSFPDLFDVTAIGDRSLSWEVPVGLRLKGGNEHWRFDWRDVPLAPVVPRRPIVQID
ncbi:hypothetical protein FOZ61_009125 [Perkinsus olseni]|nr:hypothetical protein FOZ61_009125 [Perkinsus olseni]